MKRLLKEAQELQTPTELFYAQPLDVLVDLIDFRAIDMFDNWLFNCLKDNIFEWHFTIRGPPDTDFDGGIYHGRILLPAEYPMKPPSIILLTVLIVY